MSLTPVNSSAIRAVGYNPFTGTLAVQFHSSSTIYTHHGVPYSVYAELMDAESKGGFYARHIQGRYR